jgi:hypothetical protein
MNFVMDGPLDTLHQLRLASGQENNDNSPMTEGADGVNVAAPILARFSRKNSGKHCYRRISKNIILMMKSVMVKGKTNKSMLAGKTGAKRRP